MNGNHVNDDFKIKRISLTKRIDTCFDFSHLGLMFSIEKS